MQRLTGEYPVSQRHACELLSIPRSTVRYQRRKRNGDLEKRLIELAQEKPRFGYRRLHILLRREGRQVNHKRVQRLYSLNGLKVRRIRRKKLIRSYVPREPVTAPNQEWAIDFASDHTAGGRRIRVLSVVDVFTRECLALEVDTSFPSRRVTRVLEQVATQRGMPLNIRSDNGPELTSRHYLAWCVDHRTGMIHIQPGKPTQNAHVESFHGRLRDECLNPSWFANLFDARRKIRLWRQDYNEMRPHSSLENLTPNEFARSLTLGAASPPSMMGSAWPYPPQGQALRAPAAALTQARPRAS